VDPTQPDWVQLAWDLVRVMIRSRGHRTKPQATTGRTTIPDLVPETCAREVG